MAATKLFLRHTTLAVALAPALFAMSAACAQSANDTLAPVVVTGKLPVPASVAGWDDVPLSKAPLQATTIDAAQIRDAGARRLADLVRFDASVSEAYDSEGYIDYFTVRGFVIDNRFNFRRDGLPINAETSIPLENKARVDVLKGLGGLQAGTSAPGGLVDLVVKRPLDAPLSSAFVEWRQRGSVLGAVDLSRRFGDVDGAGGAFGLRLNAAAERIDPLVRNARGQRSLLALAGDWRASSSTLVEAEVETSHRSQPSVPGFSLLGDRVPAVPDPRLNLNNQPWSLPVVFDATTASLRVTHKLGDGWRLVAHGATQRLRTDDRIAFPFGCTAADGSYYADRYCPDGTFDLYDFRSDGERRRNDALDLSLHGQLATGGLRHVIVFGALRNVVHNSFPPQAFNFAGTGNVDGTAVTTPMPATSPPATGAFDRRSTEAYLRDAIAIGARTTLWLGARHTRLDRQSFTSPFIALGQEVVAGQTLYASWGRAVESEIAPDLPRYANRGQPVPAALSRQVEAGFKGSSGRAEWNVAVFDIRRPRFD
ncbi:MAG: TonB-dependent receptor, partial [Caldimonas sp.]